MASIVPSTPQNSQDFLIAQSHPLKKKDDFWGYTRNNEKILSFKILSMLPIIFSWEVGKILDSTPLTHFD